MLCHDHRRRRRAPVQPACDFFGAAGVCAMHTCMYLIVGRPPPLALQLRGNQCRALRAFKACCDV
eukprot:6856805-Prymnesium_polylepis.1